MSSFLYFRGGLILLIFVLFIISFATARPCPCLEKGLGNVGSKVSTFSGGVAAVYSTSTAVSTAAAAATASAQAAPMAVASANAASIAAYGAVGAIGAAPAGGLAGAAVGFVAV